MAKSVDLTERAVEAAEAVMSLTGNASEDDVKARVRTLLEHYAPPDSDSPEKTQCLGQPSMGGGERADLYLPSYSTVVETKKQGKLVLEAGKAQLDRYIRHLIAKDEKGEIRYFVGILTDGKTWFAWKYTPFRTESGYTEDVLLDKKRFSLPRSLVETVFGLWDPIPVQKSPPPDPPQESYAPHLNQLRCVYDEATDDAVETKRNLWLDMLRTSGMDPEETQAQNRLFVSHTFLVALARGVIYTVNAPDKWDASCEDLLGEGFCSWVLESDKGTMWARDFLRDVLKYNWTQGRGDLIRPLYERFVDERDRKDFGEFYTPDWLAEMVVEQVLDDQWCSDAIRAALLALETGRKLEGIGVLDPACGSGTFLYFAAKRIMECGVMEKEEVLHNDQKVQVVASLVNGIDVHPVAAEMARATLMRVLGQRLPGDCYLRIYEGDSLHVQSHGTDLFSPSVEDSFYEVSSPKGTRIHLPLSFVYSSKFAKSVARLVESAKKETSYPQDIVASIPVGDKKSIDLAHEALIRIIKQEKDSVWTWYITNMAGPHQLAHRKVNRIISNPPWVSIQDIRDNTRKTSLKSFAKDTVEIWPEKAHVTNVDIAQLFLKHCRTLYLKNPDSDASGWIVKKSALKSEAWAKFRESQDGILSRSIDLASVDPFEGGGDSRRCCVLFQCLSSPPDVDEKHQVAKRVGGRLEKGLIYVRAHEE